MNLIQYRAIAKALNSEIEEALGQFKLKATRISARVDERGGEIRISIVARDTAHKDAAGNATDPDRERFKMLADVYGLRVDMLDATFSLGREEYRVIGLKPRGEKNVLIERLSDNSIRICTPDIVANAFAAAEKRRAS